MKTLIEEYGVFIISLLAVVIILLMSTTFNRKAQSSSKYALGDFQAQYEQKTRLKWGGTDNNIDSPNNPTITHIHNYSVTLSLREPTCTAQGEEIQKCSKCDKKQVVKIKALGHNYTDKVMLDSTCTAEGTLRHTCQRCSYAYNTSIALKPHDVKSVYTVDIAPTCTTLGEYSYHCKDCSYKERRNSIDKLGHDWSNWNTIQDSTCVLYGTKRHKCTRCNETEDAQISLKQHTCGDWIVEAQPTCSYSGTQSKYCTVCSTKLDSATIPSKGHSESCYTYQWDTSNPHIQTAYSETNLIFYGDRYRYGRYPIPSGPTTYLCGSGGAGNTTQDMNIGIVCSGTNRVNNLVLSVAEAVSYGLISFSSDDGVGTSGFSHVNNPVSFTITPLGSANIRCGNIYYSNVHMIDLVATIGAYNYNHGYLGAYSGHLYACINPSKKKVLICTQ